MNKILVILSVFGISLVLPIVSWAINFPDLNPGIRNPNIGAAIDSIFYFIWMLFAAFAVGMFIFAGFGYLAAKGDPGKTELAKQAVIWGVVGVVVGLLSLSIPWIIKSALGV